MKVAARGSKRRAGPGKIVEQERAAAGFLPTRVQLEESPSHPRACWTGQRDAGGACGAQAGRAEKKKAGRPCLESRQAGGMAVSREGALSFKVMIGSWRARLFIRR